MISPLQGFRVLEFEGIGPGPLAARILADMGAELTVISRPVTGDRPSLIDLTSEPLRRGKKVLRLDLKDTHDRRYVESHVESVHALIEAFRPGVMERLGLGPAECAKVNPRLVYGRMTGWGQDGPLAHSAGHDLNYVALSGALTIGAMAGGTPRVPPTVLGDGAGALALAFGIASGLLAAQRTGKGCVVDSAIVDVVACLSGIALSARSARLLDSPRPSIFHDSPFYDLYRCADGHFVSIAALEPQFFALLLEKLGIQDFDLQAQYDSATWPALKERLTSLFGSHPRAHWCKLLEGSDACFAPVLTPAEAARHPHNRHRNTYRMSMEVALDSAAAPRVEPLPCPAASTG